MKPKTKQSKRIKMRDENKQSKLVELLKDFTSGQIRQFTYKFGGVFRIESNRLDKAIRAARYVNYKNKKRRESIQSPEII